MFRYTLLLLLSLFFFAPSFSYAQTPTCTIYYGGGETDCETTPTATTAATATPQPNADQPLAETSPTDMNQTKGGQQVYTPVQTAETPATGPETFALAALIPAAMAGLYLRKKKI